MFTNVIHVMEMKSLPLSPLSPQELSEQGGGPAEDPVSTAGGGPGDDQETALHRTLREVCLSFCLPFFPSF